MTKKMIMLPLLAASVSLFFTGCEGKLVEKVDLISIQKEKVIAKLCVFAKVS